MSSRLRTISSLTRKLSLSNSRILINGGDRDRDRDSPQQCGEYLHPTSIHAEKLQGVPKHWAHFVFVIFFLGFWITYRGTSDLYSTALDICYMIATRILKIDLEIAVPLYVLQNPRK